MKVVIKSRSSSKKIEPGHTIEIATGITLIVTRVVRVDIIQETLVEECKCDIEVNYLEMGQ